MEFSHVSVLLQESVDWIVTDPAGIYVDCTLGGAGHSHAIAASTRTTKPWRRQKKGWPAYPAASPS